MPKKPPEQLYLDGQAPLPDVARIPEVEERIYAALAVADEIGEGVDSDPFARVRSLMKSESDASGDSTGTEH